MAAIICRKRLFNYKNNIFQPLFRTGYIVLIPEAPEENVPSQSLEEIELNPDYRTLKGDLCKQMFAKQCQEYDTTSWEICKTIKDKMEKNEKIDVLKTIIEPLEKVVVPFASTWGYARALYEMNQEQLNAKDFFELNNRAEHIRQEKFNQMPIYEACKAALETEPEKFNEEEKRLFNKFVYQGRMQGLYLDAIKKSNLLHVSFLLEDKVRQCRERIALAHRTTYNMYNDANVMINDYPVDLLRCSAPSIDKTYMGPWKMGHQKFLYERFMEYCPSREHRYNHFLAHNQMGSPNADQRLDISRDFRDVRKFREQAAHILGYDNYADMQLEGKMMESVEEVQEMLYLLLEKAKPLQEKEVNDLEQFAFERGFEGNIELYDLAFWSRKKAKTELEFDEIALMDYFPLNQVLLGLFSLCEQLFGIEIKQKKLNKSWHPDVRFYEVYDEKSKEMLGDFYIDPYARNGKLYDEYLAGNLIQLKPTSKLVGSKPSLAMVFHFSQPDDKKPCLLFFREVKHLFKKFGFVLQQILCEGTYFETASLQNVELDAIGVCGNFLEQWVYESGTLESISGHYKTGEPLPKNVIQKMGQLQKHMAGTKLCFDIYYSNLDLNLHTQMDKATMEIVREMWPNYFLFKLDNEDMHPYMFNESIVGPLTCCYYSVIWSRIVGIDAFKAFEEAGFDNHEKISKLGRRFRSTFFALSGTCHASDVFKRFRGRNPSLFALVNHLDMDATKHVLSSTDPKPTPAITS